MTIRHLKTFIAVCECGGITRAAETMHVAQPAVSQTIAELERYYDVILFDRLGKKLALTDYGRQLLAKAKETVASFDDFEALANKRTLDNRVRIGSSLTIGRLVMPEILNTVRQNCPAVTALAVIDDKARIEGLLLDGTLDFTILEGDVQSAELISEAVGGDRLSAVCGTAFPAPAKITPAELAAYPVLLRERGSASREAFDGMALANDLSVNVTVESASNSALIACAKAGVGIAVLPEALVAEDIAAGSLRLIQIQGCSFARIYYLAYHKNKRFSPAQNTALSIAKRAFGYRTPATDVDNANNGGAGALAYKKFLR